MRNALIGVAKSSTILIGNSSIGSTILMTSRGLARASLSEINFPTRRSGRPEEKEHEARVEAGSREHTRGNGTIHVPGIGKTVRVSSREFLFLCLSFDFINTCKLTPFVRSFVSGPSRPDTRRRERIINRSTIGVAVGEDFSAGGAPFNNPRNYICPNICPDWKRAGTWETQSQWLLNEKFSTRV